MGLIRNLQWLIKIFLVPLEERIYMGSQNHSCPIHEKLTEDHFELTPSSLMRNRLAEDVLDRKRLYL